MSRVNVYTGDMTNTDKPLRFTAALIAIKGETRTLLPARPGLPGQPKPSFATVTAWAAATKATALVLAQGRIDLAEAALADGNRDRAAEYVAEARALIALGHSR